MIEDLVREVASWPAPLAFAGLALSAFLENVVPPVPGDLVVVLSAYLAGRGALDWVWVYLATCSGGLAGFLTMFAIGRRQGRAFFEARRGGVRGRGRMAVFSPRRLAQAEGWLARWGVWLVLANRFLSGVRSVIALAAGVGGMRWRTVAAAGLVSIAVWNGLLLYAGLTVGENWEQISQLLGRYNRVLLILGAITAAVLGLRLLWKRHRRRSGTRPPVDSPTDGA